MKKIELDIVALSHSVTQSNNYAVVLGELDGARRLPVVIGAFEAQAIAVAIEGMVPNRPLTHDLFKNTLDTFDIGLQEIVINNLVEGIFYARLICLRNGELIEIDSRTSDAIALSVRFKCPIYTYEFILDTAGIVLEEDENTGAYEVSMEEVEEEKTKSLGSVSIDELQQQLDQVLREENYERAAQIRDEISRRKAQND
ncbi:MAG: bifunctional nuclease family protein [Saprospiraceae bacterium]